MESLDINQMVVIALASCGVGGGVGGGVWAAIRIEIKYLWRNVDRHDERIKELEKGAH